uniref:Chromosome 1 open reading frame 141 n=1 Tax=Macrostomum lignano TaxID=282301 RepID=A0A1I8F8Z9_9PLAT
TRGYRRPYRRSGFKFFIPFSYKVYLLLKQQILLLAEYRIGLNCSESALLSAKRHSGTRGSARPGRASGQARRPKRVALPQLAGRARWSAELPDSAQSCFGRAALCPPRLLRTPKRNVESPLSEETLANASERRAAGNRLAARRCRAKRGWSSRQLTEVANPAQRTRAAQAEALASISARQEFAELLGDFPSPSWPAQLPDPAAGGSRPADPWLSRLAAEIRQILETASSTSFATEL